MKDALTAEQNGFAYFRQHALHQATQNGKSWYAFDFARGGASAMCACGEWFASSRGYHWHESGRCHTRGRCTP